MRNSKSKFQVSRFTFQVSSFRFQVNLKHETWNLKRNRHGQALLELAIFGGLMIVVLGSLVSYGLNADYTQQAMMQAFRQALGTAANATNNGAPISASHVIVNDRHIPDPSNPFGLGNVVPITGQAQSPARNFGKKTVPETNAELPRFYLTINSLPVDCNGPGSGCTTAGLRVENNVPGGSLDRYKEIFGDSNTCVCDGDEHKPDSCGSTHPGCAGASAGACLTQGGLDPVTGNRLPCQQFARKIVIVDGCDGQIVNLDSCRRQAERLTNAAMCERECARGRPLVSAPPSKDVKQPLPCSEVCAEPIISIPWYAQDADHDGNFEQLEALFAGIRSMGVQSTFTKRTEMGTSTAGPTTLVKAEHTADCPDGSCTTTTYNAVDTTTRTFIALDPSHGNAATPRSITTRKTRTGRTTWDTPN